MENKSYQLRYLPLFEQDLISTANYITNVLKNEDAALRLIDDVMEVRRLMYGARDTDVFSSSASTPPSLPFRFPLLQENRARA